MKNNSFWRWSIITDYNAFRKYVNMLDSLWMLSFCQLNTTLPLKEISDTLSPQSLPHFNGKLYWQINETAKYIFICATQLLPVLIHLYALWIFIWACNELCDEKQSEFFYRILEFYFETKSYLTTTVTQNSDGWLNVTKRFFEASCSSY